MADMERDERIAYLRYPLYKLYYLDTLDGFVFEPDEAKRVLDQYGVDWVSRIVEALAWADKTPGIDWNQVLPNLKKDDREIRIYISAALPALRAVLESGG